MEIHSSATIPLNNTANTLNNMSNGHGPTTLPMLVDIREDENAHTVEMFENNKENAEIKTDNMERKDEITEPEIDIVINNVVGSFAVGCHLNLRNIATEGYNVEYRKENGMVTMKLRRPYVTASMWCSGKITCTGSTSEEQAKVAARRVARVLQKLGYNCKFRNFRVVNVLGTCTMPFAIRISLFSQKYRKAASYEPELHPGVTYRIEDPKATLKIFSTGSITITAPSVANVQSAIETIYPLVKEFSKPRNVEDKKQIETFNPLRYIDEIELNSASEPNDESSDETEPC